MHYGAYEMELQGLCCFSQNTSRCDLSVPPFLFDNKLCLRKALVTRVVIAVSFGLVLMYNWLLLSLFSSAHKNLTKVLLELVRYEMS